MTVIGFLGYWSKLLGMTVYSQTDTSALLGYADDQVSYHNDT